MSDYPHSRPKSSGGWLLPLVLIVVILALVYWLFVRDRQPEPVAVPAVTAPAVVEAPPVVAPPVVVEPEVVYEPPVAAPAPEPLPLLNESDAPLLESLANLRQELLALLVPQELVRKFVMATNAAAEGKVVTEYRPVVSPPPPFIPETYQVTVNGESVAQQRIARANFDRYGVYVNTLAQVDPDTLAALYRRFYPLLEEAFAELGLKKSNFHSVMIAAIDNILAAPEVQGDMLLIHPKVFYQFADPVLEKLPQTHKLMLRMGPENARSVKASLRQLRSRLLTQ